MQQISLDQQFVTQDTRIFSVIQYLRDRNSLFGIIGIAINFARVICHDLMGDGV